MKKISLYLLPIFAFVAMLLHSCVDTELLEGSLDSEKIYSKTIIFSSTSSWGENADVITKSSQQTFGNRLGNRTLTSKDSVISLPMGIYINDWIKPTSDVQTKGAIVSNASQINSFNVWASFAISDTEIINYFSNVEYTKDGDYFVSDEENEYYWPGSGTLNFVSVANIPSNGFTAKMEEGNKTIQSFSYTVSTDATKQNDIMVATTSAGGNSNTSVPLTFNHIMSAVSVKLGSLPSSDITIKSLKIKNIYNSGNYNISSGSWERNGTKDDYTVFTENGDSEFTLNNAATGSTINGGNYTLMLLPQQLADDALIEIICQYQGTTSPVTLTASIAKDANGNYYTWEKGKTTNYIISIDENYHLQVIPQGNVLDAHYIMTTASVKVSELGNGQTWYVKVSADDITTSEDISLLVDDGNVNSYIRDGYWINSIDGNIPAARGTKTIEGNATGVTDIIIFIPENITSGDRRITLEYGIKGQESNAKKEYLYQKCPYWDNANTWGWEKVDDENSGTYGFEWTRKACYMFAYKIGGWHNWTQYNEDYIRGIINPLIQKFNAEAYVTIDRFKHYVWEKSGLGGLWGSYTWKEDGERIAVVIDYTLLTLDGASSEDDGWANTKAFFDARNIIAFEDALKAVTKVREYNDDGTLQTAFRMLETYLPGNGATQSEATCGKFTFGNYTYIDPSTGQETNKMFREFGELDDASGILKYVIMRNAYDVVSYDMDDNNSTLMLDMNSEKIKWYLPAKNQYVNMNNFEFATGNATFAASDFWSSTAAPNNQAYTGAGDAISRNEKRKVIVQRKVDAIPVTSTVDNSSLQGGNNGSTNNWVE